MLKKVLYILVIAGLIGSLLSCNPPYGPWPSNSCKNCHKIEVDKSHSLACTKCHKGDSNKYNKAGAHKGLITHPASIRNAKFFCEPCHKKETNSVIKSTHYTLENEIKEIWTAFFPKSNPPSITQLKGISFPNNKKELLMDLLARRCLRCHVYYEGDDYEGTYRGLGCASCHMDSGKKKSHIFHKPKVANCLSCHYGNFVGWDFVGRFEKDYPEDFRAPLKNGRHLKRRYAIEWIDMSADIHFQKGLTCIDCHTGKEFHPEKGKIGVISCKGCHKSISNRFGHQNSNFKISCGSCHAKWGFYDFGQDLLRIDDPDPEDWSFLKVQTSSEIEMQKNSMTDKIHGNEYRGIWLKGYIKRRWWPVILGISKSGEIDVIRPILDISISYLNQDDEVLFEKIRPIKSQTFSPLQNKLSSKKANNIWLPYTPHTIGKADIFRTLFLKGLLNKKKGSNK